MTGDPYQILGVSHDADAEQIKQAYRRLAKQYHPDLHPGDAEAARRMNEINEAYDLIKNPDAYRRQQAQQAQQQTWQTYQTAYQQRPDQQSYDPFSFFRDAGGTQYWVHFGGFGDGADEQRQNGQNANGQNPYQWTYHRTRRRGGLLWRILTIYLVIQFILTLFGGCGYRLNSGYDYSADPYDPYSNYYSDYYGGSSGQPSGTTTPQQNTRGFGSINS